jgi:peptide chain release factor 1
VTIAVLQGAETVRSIELNDKDVLCEFMKASGPGGQHVNKTNSAVRLTHIPTGISVSVREERCAQQNKKKALQMLITLLQNNAQSEAKDSIKSQRNFQIGAVCRSDKIRTYNFPQSRITDHRLGDSLYDLEKYFRGESLNYFIEQLIRRDERRKLDEFLETFSH